MSETVVVVDESNLQNAFPVVQVLWPDLEMECENTIKFYQSQLGDAFGVVFRTVTGPPDL
ncbi:MAG: hypothetical protein F4Y79_22700 [Gemmatimonadetes bacterium]|nr:hypothetical protein [Gemmatimonadota bacterium]MYF17189.1 hypothetical protein [Gemmatimonadota bacterium]